MKLELSREHSLEQTRFKIAEVFDAGTLYQMTKNQNMGDRKILKSRFKRPAFAAPFVVRDHETFNELVNLVTLSLTTNMYLNLRYNELMSIAKELDTAIMREYGNQFID
jgi:hypothetical protein